jgi:GNAT superfamily N-acetyltransferase
MEAAQEGAPAATRPLKLTFKPVTQSTRDDFVAVFEGTGGPKYCWCMAYRLTKDEAKDAATSDARRKLMLGRIDSRVPTGLLGYANGEPVAWVSVAPKTTFNDKLGGPEPDEGQKVWSLTCMYMRRQLRGYGLGHAMIDAAIKLARKKGATILEAYPVDPTSPSYRFMGFVPAFESVGFKEIGREGSRRHVMRLTLKPGSQAKS